MAKRCFDLFLTIPGIVILLPLFLVIAGWIKLDSGGKIFFRQERVGRFGKPFFIYKFRTMCVNAEQKGRQITVGDDSRITKSGYFLRKYKIDELPQLINVLKGEMSLVGPRPEVPRYVACYPEHVKTVVLSVLPGITDQASIEYKNENEILGRAADPDKAYVEEVLPIKLCYYVEYVKNRSLLGDLKIVCQTILAIVR